MIVERRLGQAGLAERGDAQVGPADEVADGPVDGRVDAGVRQPGRRQDGDAEGDPEDRQDRAQRARARPRQARPLRPRIGLEAELGEPGDERRRVVVGAPAELDRLADAPVADDEHAVGVGGGLGRRG